MIALLILCIVNTLFFCGTIIYSTFDAPELPAYAEQVSNIQLRSVFNVMN